ncbi:MAG: hypothetical protein K2X69_17085 [Silvanigrellaceae bacterium]|nr:hypothetical protein [Silvanigrellaceae bacterium]
MKPVDIKEINAFYRSELKKHKELNVITLRSVIKASEATIEHFNFNRDESK